MSDPVSPLAAGSPLFSNATYLASANDVERCLLLFSGGLDTSCMVHWLTHTLGCEVHTLTVDVGQCEDFGRLAERAYALGAKMHHYVDARTEFADDFCLRAIKADAVVSQFGHPLSASLTRPLITRIGVDIAASQGITALAHGATGRANDSLRIDSTVLALAPAMKVLAPVREWGMKRPAELEYAREHGIEVTATPENSCSVDDNLWARETEAGGLDDLSLPVPDHLFVSTPPAKLAGSRDVVVSFKDGAPIEVDGDAGSTFDIITRLNGIAGAYAIGQFDYVEDRGIGVKVRELHEAPGAAVLLRAHAELASLVLSREELRLMTIVEAQWVDSALNGFWFTPLMGAMNAFLDALNARVTGALTLRLERKSVTPSAPGPRPSRWI